MRHCPWPVTKAAFRVRTTPQDLGDRHTWNARCPTSKKSPSMQTQHIPEAFSDTRDHRQETWMLRKPTRHSTATHIGRKPTSALCPLQEPPIFCSETQ